MRKTASNLNDGGCGYILWYPMTHDSGETSSTYPEDDLISHNIFTWSNSSSSTRPVNTGTHPFGHEANPFPASGDQPTTGHVDDPFAFFVGGQGYTAEDARLLCACIRMTYTGRMDASAGQVAFIENLPLSALTDENDNSLGSLSPSVDDLFASASRTTRLGVDPLEIIYRPPDDGHQFLDSTARCIAYKPTLGSNSFLGDYPSNHDAHVFGFAWRGLVSGVPANQIFEFTKAVEWRPRATLGYRRPASVSTPGGSHVAKAKAMLDRVDPNWSTRLVEFGKSAVSEIAQAALTGSIGLLL